jgi:hypothetical protein
MSIRLPRPTGIRNGGLLLVLVALAAARALVDRPPEPDGWRRPAGTRCACIRGRRSGPRILGPGRGGLGPDGRGRDRRRRPGRVWHHRPAAGHSPGGGRGPGGPGPGAGGRGPGHAAGGPGRDLPKVRIRTPEGTVEAPTADVPRLRSS